MPITQEQIDALKKECEAVLELGGGEVLATLPAHDVLELANSHSQLKERVEELEGKLQQIAQDAEYQINFLLKRRETSSGREQDTCNTLIDIISELSKPARAALSNTKGDG